MAKSVALTGKELRKGGSRQGSGSNLLPVNNCRKIPYSIPPLHLALDKTASCSTSGVPQQHGSYNYTNSTLFEKFPSN